MSEAHLPPEVMAPPPAPPRKSFPPNPYSDDDGSAPAELMEAFAAKERTVAVVAALAEARVLVPVLPHDHPGRTADGGVVGHSGLNKRSGQVTDADAATPGEVEESSECGSPTLVSVELADGRHALPVFSSMDAMLAWNPTARPIPMPAPRIALASASESDGVLLLDPASPHATVIPRPAVWSLIQGEEWVPAARNAELPALIARTLTGILPVAGVRVEPGSTTEIRVVVALRPGLDTQELQTTLAEVSQRLRGSEEITHRVESMELYPTSLAQS